jgi:hypothetical protein
MSHAVWVVVLGLVLAAAAALPVGHAYSGMPDRLPLIDREGRIADKGGRGPFGSKPGELDQAVAMLLLDEALAKRGK